MGTKKSTKKKKDARGYGQASQTSSTSSGQITNNSNDDESFRWIAAPRNESMTLQLQERLDAMYEKYIENSTTASKSQAFTPPSSWPRFRTKLQGIVEQLLDIDGMTRQLIEMAVPNIGFADLSVSSVLDYLCWHVPSQDLPPILTEGIIRQQYQQQASTSIEAIAPIKREKDSETESEPVIDNRIPRPMTKDPNVEKKKEEAKAAISQQQKDWLLSQYAYDEEETRNVVVKDDTPSADILPEQVNLEAVQKQLDQLNLDLNDEAGNYMRSKYEIKEMKKQANQLQSQVKGLQRKLDKARAEQRRAAEKLKQETVQQDTVDQNDTIDEIEEDGEMGLFGFLEQEEADTVMPTPEPKEEVPAEPLLPYMKIEIQDDAIPTSWTGARPFDLLKDTCKQNKWKFPTFSQLSNATCSLKIYDKEFKYPGKKSDDIKEYLSFVALFHECSHLQLHRRLPPFYRDLWLSWKDDAAKEKQHIVEQATAEMDEFLDILIRSIPIASTVMAVNEAKNRNTDDRSADDDDYVTSNEHQEDWDESSDTVANEAARRKNISIESKRMRDKFVKTQKTKEYEVLYKQRCALPMHARRDEILNTVNTNSCVVICAETGAGKTTQLPQYILEQAILESVNGNETSIICTQPRRVAAVSVAERVAEEMGESAAGQLVGYQIRLEAVRSTSTRLLFCTTGVVLRKLVDNPTLDGVTHVIVDEVHERQWQIDMLLVTLRNLLHGSRPDLKVILMSATLDASLFCNFFNNAPLINVSGRTFPVATYFLEDLFDATNHIVEDHSRYAVRNYAYDERTSTVQVTSKGGEKETLTVSMDSELDVNLPDDFVEYKLSTRRSMERVDETVINYDLVEDLFNLLFAQKDFSYLSPPDNVDITSGGAFLVFLPGVGEIRELYDRLVNSKLLNDEGVSVLPLHSLLSSDEQRKAFIPCTGGKRKIILSTNIAETSVTIPDVVCVIDCGRVREVQYDERTSTRKLLPQWCAKANIKQRAGRAGRVQPGMCLRLFSSRTMKRMKSATQPEIRRIPLEEVCLNILAARLSTNCAQFLSQVPEPPQVESVSNALSNLEEIGAIKLLGDKVESRHEVLTPLGKHLSKLPVDCRLGKMLIYGALFKCFDSLLTIVATMSASKSPFLANFDNDEATASIHKRFKHPNSDFLTFVNLWYAFDRASSSGKAYSFCRNNRLNFTAMKEISDGRREYYNQVRSIGLIDKIDKTKNGTGQEDHNKYCHHESLINAIIFAGLYPNFGKGELNKKGNEVVHHQSQILEISKKSVNCRTGQAVVDRWIVYSEKFGTSYKVTISVTCFAHIFAILFFAGNITLDHLKRRAIIDKWAEIEMAAKTAMTFIKLREYFDEEIERNLQSSKDGDFLDQICSIISQQQ